MCPVRIYEKKLISQDSADDNKSMKNYPACKELNGFIYEPRHEISNNVVCVTSKASDQPAHMPSLIRAFASRLNIL